MSSKNKKEKEGIINMAETGKKYQKLVFSRFREEVDVPYFAKPQAYFRGASQIPGAGANFGWQVIIEPVQLETEPHTHNADEYLIFLGTTPPDLFSSFDAQADLWLGEEMEQYLIDKPTIVFIPKGLQHCPLNFRKINKPVLFTALELTPVFTKTMNGKEYVFEGPRASQPRK
jgi:hypothetical protein